jgi:hypothetical protein
MYILALLKRDDMTTEQVREFCTTELQDFLKDGIPCPSYFNCVHTINLSFQCLETKPFIARLFDVLQEMTSQQSGGGKEFDDSRKHERRRNEEEEDDRYSRRSDDSRKRRTDERERSPAHSSQWGDDDRDRKRRRGGSEERSYSDEERERSPSRRDGHKRERERDTREVQPPSSSRRHDQREDRVNIDKPLSSSRSKDDIRGSWEERQQPSSVISTVNSRYDDGRGRDWARRGGGRDGGRPGGDYGRITGRKRGVCYDFEGKPPPQTTNPQSNRLRLFSVNYVSYCLIIFLFIIAERGVCVRGENCEYEHLGRPLVVDEAGLSKLQGSRGTFIPPPLYLLF